MLLNPLNRRVREHRGFPVFSGAFPVIGHLPAVHTDLLTLFRRAKQEHGSHVWIDYGFGLKMLFCLFPESLSLLNHKAISSQCRVEMCPDILENVVTTQDGQLHRNLRSRMNEPFLPKGLTAAEIGGLFAGIIERKLQAWQTRREICLQQETHELALSLVFRMMEVEEADYPIWHKKSQEFFGLLYAPPIDLPGMPRPRGRRARAWLDEQVRSRIRNARAEPNQGGTFAALVRSFDAGDGDVSNVYLEATLRGMMAAASETTATTMTWLVIMLAQYPEVWDALCAEAIAIGTPPQSPKELGQFPYAEAVFRETVRLHPPAPTLMRNTLADIDIAGRTIKAGTKIGIPLLYLSHDAGMYEKPDEFLPARWLERKGGITSIDMMQFGGGPHFCLGYHLAWLEIVQFAVTLALTMNAAGLRPQLARKGNITPRYLPLMRPPAATRVVFA